MDHSWVEVSKFTNVAGDGSNYICKNCGLEIARWYNESFELVLKFYYDDAEACGERVMRDVLK